MKILFENYTFNSVEKKITFNSTETITQERLLIITNVTDNLIIYNFADPNLGGVITENVLTLTYDTTTMSDSDKLQIFIENSYTPASNEMLDSIDAQTVLLRRMVKLLEPSSVAGSTGRQQVDINSITPAVLMQQYQHYIGSLATVISTQESTFNLQSRIAYIALRNNLEFS